MPMNACRRTRAVLVSVVVVLSSCQQSSPLPALKPGAPPPGGPTLTFQYVKEGGCGDIFLHKGTADDREVLWISADKKKLNLPAKGSSTFDLAKVPEGLQVAVDQWDQTPKFSAYCNDISPNAKKVATWKARKGKLTITLAGPAEPAQPGRSNTYKASVRLEGVVFEDDAGHQATLKEETITDAMVGWYAG
jgi:hypothetical protein